MPRNTTRCPQPGFKPWPRHPGSGALTRPTCLQLPSECYGWKQCKPWWIICFSIVQPQFVLHTFFFRNRCFLQNSSVIHSIVGFIFRFDELKELSSNRQSQLEDSLGLHQFFYDIEMEMAWIREHMTLATSEDLGTSLIGVQRLQKRHLVISFFYFFLCK